MGLRLNGKVEMRVDELGAVVLDRSDFDLATALAVITPDNLHGEADFGESAGKSA